jgi:hypothetical protein
LDEGTNFEGTVVGGLEFEFVEGRGYKFGWEVERQGFSVLGQNGMAVNVVVGHSGYGGRCRIKGIQIASNRNGSIPLMARLLGG